jgi:PAS domain S-box-containing protein
MIAVVLVHIDLTARVEAEAELRSSEERGRMALDAGRMGSWQYSIDSERIEWSESLARLHGCELDSLPDTFAAYQSAIYPDDRERVAMAVKRSIDGSDHHVVYRIIRPDGAVRWLDARGRLLRDSSGNPQRLVGVCSDVTEARQAEATARFLAEASVVLASSLDYDVTLANVARLAVSTLADYCIVDLLEPISPDGVRRVATAHADMRKQDLVDQVRRFPPILDSNGIVARAVRTGTPQLVTHLSNAAIEASAEGRPEHQEILRALGPQSILCVPMIARGLTIGTMLFAHAQSGRRYTSEDVDLGVELGRRAALAVDNARLLREMGEARAAAEEAAEVARAANRAKADFLAVMSHELRTPLNAIGGYTDLIEMGLRGPVSEEQRTDLVRIKRSQRHLLSLINDLLNYAKLEAGSVQYAIETLSVDEILDGIEPLIGPQIAAKELTLEWGQRTEPLTIRADSEKVQQILLNVLSNAVKFTPAGGTIGVVAECDGPVVRIAVTDTGIGIPADKLDVIFEPFVQLSRGLTQHREGTGLGLAISRDLARAMGGDLRAESEVGRGSRFTLELIAG